MSVLTDARERLADALGAVEGVRYYRDPAGDVSPPATVLGPAELAWDGVCGPTSATFRVYLMHALDERAAEKLPELVLLVADAVDGLPEAVVTQATAGVFNAGGTNLPSYEITVEVAL